MQVLSHSIPRVTRCRWSERSNWKVLKWSVLSAHHLTLSLATTCTTQMSCQQATTAQCIFNDMFFFTLLQDVKSKMSLTVSVHVYSVQKASLKDSGPLYSVDYDAVKDNLNSCSRYVCPAHSYWQPLSSTQTDRNTHRCTQTRGYTDTQTYIKVVQLWLIEPFFFIRSMAHGIAPPAAQIPDPLWSVFRWPFFVILFVCFFSGEISFMLKN